MAFVVSLDKKNAFTVGVVFILWINVIILQSFSKNCLSWGIPGNGNLDVVCYFFLISHAVNNLLLRVWFPGSWLELPRLILDTAPLFSPLEQYLNVESTPILTEDAQSWIWVEVGSSDTLRGGVIKRPMWLPVLPALRKSQLSLCESYLYTFVHSQDWLFFQTYCQNQPIP